MTLRFHYHNKFDDLAESAITVSSAVATLPKTYLQSPFRTECWRTTGLSNQYVKWDFGGEENFSYIALLNHNLTNAAEITITASNNSDFSSPVFEETYDARLPIFGLGECGLGEYGMGGYIPDDQLAEIAAGSIRIINLDVIVSARYAKAEFSDAANPDGYIEAGRLFTGVYWEPGRNFKWGYKILPEDASTSDLAAGGEDWVDEEPCRYILNFDITIQDQDLYWKLIDMLRRWGKRKDILLSMFPEGNPSQKFFTTLYGKFKDIPEITHVFINKNPINITFRESL